MRTMNGSSGASLVVRLVNQETPDAGLKKQQHAAIEDDPETGLSFKWTESTSKSFFEVFISLSSGKICYF